MTMGQRVGSLFRRELPVFQRPKLHVAHGCNLSCESCSHYSNHAHSGTVSLKEANRWMGLWGRRVSVVWFTILGGEPTIHPQAYLPMQKAKYRLSDKWVPYLAYQPLEPGRSRAHQLRRPKDQIGTAA